MDRRIENGAFLSQTVTEDAIWTPVGTVLVGATPVFAAVPKCSWLFSGTEMEVWSD